MFKKNPNKPLDGRKYRLGIIMMLVFLGGFALTGINPVLATVYAELVTGCGIIYLTYCGHNVGNKWVLGRKQDTKENQDGS